MPRHVAEVPARPSDVDQRGRVSNIAFLRFLQEARVGMLFVDAAGPDLARGVVVHRHEIAYRASLTLGTEAIRVETWVRRLNAASFELGYEVLDGDGTVYAVASSTLVPYNMADGRPRRVGRADRAVLEDFVADGPEPGVDITWAAGGTAFTTTCAPRFDDLDSYGHVNNVILADYAQQAAYDFQVEHLTPVAEPTGMTIDYLQPIPFRAEPLTVVARVTRVGDMSFDMSFDVRDADSSFARIGSVMAAIDTETGGTRALTDSERRVLNGLAGSPDPVVSR